MFNLRSLAIKERLSILRLFSFFIILFSSLSVSNLTYALTPDNQVSVQTEKRLLVTQNPTLIVGSEQDFLPFSKGMTDATAGGFTVELWKAVASEADLRYTIRVLPFHELLQEFKAGKIDVLINLAQSEQRKQFADFTVPHVVVNGAIFVRKGDTSISSENDFSGKSIIVLSSDLAHNYAVSKGWERQLVLVNTAEEGLRLLASGKHDVMLLSKLTGMQTLQAAGLTNIEALKNKVGFSQKFSFAVLKGQADLLGRINEALAITKSNETYNTIYETWFGIYEVKEASLRDNLKYLTPIIFIFLCILGYLFYRRRAERKAADEINNLAFYDSLTQVPNRRLLFDRLNHALASSARSGERGALLFIDLDKFKTLNDTLGHDMGDLLLQQVAARLTAIVREGDTVARLGGDEFVVLLEDLSEQDLEAASQTKDVAEKILLSLSQPYQLGTHRHHSTASIGATLFEGHKQGLEDLLKQADVAMYQSKSEGRNTLWFFDPKMQEYIAKRADMANELRMAIELNQLKLYYQVQVDFSGQALGAEVLIRWIHPERGMISPFNFIPLAEDTGLILPIGQLVLDTACAQLKAWQQNPLTKDLTLSVNVSTKQFYQVDFVEQVLATIARHNINPSYIKLELTESILAHNINDLITKMNALSTLGIRFSLDDFGTGYSSLQYLKKLPLEQLKLDQSFVRDIASDNTDKVIVRTIITMACSLNVIVIAEGVETEEQRQYLFDNGCKHYQGSLFGMPVPIDEFEALLRTS